MCKGVFKTIDFSIIVCLMECDILKWVCRSSNIFMYFSFIEKNGWFFRVLILYSLFLQSIDQINDCSNTWQGVYEEKYEWYKIQNII